MANNRISIKIPREAFIKLRMKKISMENRFRQVYGKQRKIPMTKLIGFISQRPIYIADDELKYLFNKRANKKSTGGFSLL